MTHRITVKDANFRVLDQHILKAIDLEIRQDELTVIIGPSGAGKSSLLKTLLGLLPATRQAVSIDDQAISQIDHRQRASYLAWLPQQLDVSEQVRVKSLIAAARFRFDESKASCQQKVSTVLNECAIEDLAEHRIPTLSGGELQRVAIAAMLAQESSFLLLDEPANHLDPGLMMHISSLLMRQWQKGCGLVIVTHQLNLILQGVAIQDHHRVRVIGMQQGQIRFDLKLSDQQLIESLNSLYGVKIRLFEQADQRMLVTLFDDDLIARLKPAQDRINHDQS